MRKWLLIKSISSLPENLMIIFLLSEKMFFFPDCEIIQIYRRFMVFKFAVSDNSDFLQDFFGTGKFHYAIQMRDVRTIK